MKAMVLAAGLGTRLRPITYDIPKPLAPVLDKPVMEHTLDLLKRHGFTDIISNIHYFPEKMQGYFGDGSKWGLNLELRCEDELMGTAGGVRNVRDFFGDEAFLIISGDALTDIDLGAFVERHEAARGVGTLALKKVDNTSEYGVVILDKDGRITGFQEKPDPSDAISDLANCGMYIFEPEIFDYFPEGDFADWAADVFPTLLERNVPFHGHEIAEYWNDIGTLDEYRQGNFDALTGAVKVDFGADEQGSGIFVGKGAQIAPGAELAPPVYVGANTVIRDGAKVMGPAVIGKNSTVGAGSALREVVLWPDSTVEQGTFAIEAISGPL